MRAAAPYRPPDDINVATSSNASIGIVDAYPLSPMQQGMLYHWLRDPQGGVDLEQITCTLDSVDVPTLTRAWAHLAERHASLRTAFRWQDVDAPVQEVFAAVPLIVYEQDLREHDPAEQRRFLDAYLDADRRRGFDFASPPLFRLAYFRTTESQYEFVWTFPHILLDGRSFVILIRELVATYIAFEQQRTPEVAEPRPYRDFIDWLQNQDAAAASAFWSRTLAGFSSPVYPELGAVDVDNSTREYDEQGLRLSRDDTNALREFARRHELTLNTMVQGAWALLLSKYAASDDIVFGATRASRRSPLGGDVSVNDMVGLFINTLPVRARIHRDEPVLAMLKRLREDQIAVRVAEHTTLTQVQAASDVPSGVSLFDTMLVYEHEQQSTTFDAIDPRFTNFRLREKTTFPLTLHGYGEDELLLRFEYYCSKFSDAAIARMLGHLAALLREMMTKGERPAHELEMLSLAERQQLEAWNHTEHPGSTRDTTLTELLVSGAARTPHAVALERGSETMTYGELHARADTLARALALRGVGPGVMVGICMERSFEMIVGLLGILKAGGAYVPLDPDYPPERLAFMLADARCPVLLTQRDIAITKLARLPRYEHADIEEPVAAVLCVDSEWDRIVADTAAAEAPTPAGPDDLAYMIYTSGSTGRPKGAMNRHRGIVNFLLWLQEEFALTASDAVPQKTPVSFDLSVPELFLPLLAGARLVIAEPGSHRDPANLATLMRDHAVTVMFIVPSMLRAFLDSDAPMPASLRNATCSGEALPFDLQERFFAQFPDARLYNLYGPTEAAVEATYWRCQRDDPRRMVPVGRPVANTRIHILDTAMHHVPIGVPGELYIGGVQVGAGYHRRPELTAERFIPDPFMGAHTSARLYRTGDRARRLEDGTIEYLGRLDFQVKLRGFRIEVGEIEAALNADDAVRDCAVVLRTDPGIEPRLVAYYVPAGGGAVPPAALRGRLDEFLPSYMVPWIYMPLDVLPLSPSGKLDRLALPAPEGVIQRAVTVAPRDDVEARVLRIWTDVLGATNIGVTDRFNEVGGHSLAAVRVFSRIAKEFERKLQLVTMLRHDTVEQIAELLREPARDDAWHCIVPFTTRASGVPIFCTHAQTGNVLIYQHFAKEVSEHHPVYGIQAYGNWGTQDPHESIDEMVEFYVAEILKVRPTGPYIFLGGSLGGLLALELARTMRARGHEVRMLVMYDTAAPGYPRYTVRGSIARFARTHGGIPIWRLRGLLAPNPTNEPFLRMMYRRLRVTARWWFVNTRRDYLYWKYEQHNPPQDFPMPANLTRVRLASRRVVGRYRTRFYDGKITYFRADRQPEGAIFDPTNGWKDLCAELEIHPLSSGHVDGMSYPVVVQLARTFLECVARQSRTGSSAT